MSDSTPSNPFVDALSRWEDTTLHRVLSRFPERKHEFGTSSDIPVERLYLPDAEQAGDYLEQLGFPGQYPYHAWRTTNHVSGPLLDNAPVCRFWYRRREQSALQIPDRPRAKRDCLWHSISPPRSAMTPTIPWRWAKWARLGSPFPRWPTWRPCWMASPWIKSPSP